MRIRLRQAVLFATDHALGILESTDDEAFWGEEFFDEHCDDGEWQVLKRAKEIILNRLRKKEAP